MPRLSALMPWLEALRCLGKRCGGCGTAAAGHPTLRELKLFVDEIEDPDDAIEWYDTLEKLLRLSDLRLFVSSPSFDDEDYERDCCAASGIARVSEALRGCSALTRFDFYAAVYPRMQDMLAMVGAAAGERLVWLRLDGAHLKPACRGGARIFRAAPLLPLLKAPGDRAAPGDASRSRPSAPPHGRVTDSDAAHAGGRAAPLPRARGGVMATDVEQRQPAAL